MVVLVQPGGRGLNGSLQDADAPRKIVVDDAEPDLLETLAEERDRMTERINFLTRNRDAIASYLAAVNEATAQRRADGAA